MDLELVRLGDLNDNKWFFTILIEAGASWQRCIEVVRPTILYDEKSVYIVGRVPFHQEDAYVLGLKAGEIL